MTDANQNPPCERDWTEEEKEEFFASTDAITGIPNESLAGAWARNSDIPSSWMNTSKPTGIHITSIVPPEQGWPVAMYCPICKVTTFLLSPWAIKPEKGDYWRMNEMCADSEEHTYNMSLTRWSFKLLDPPPSPRLPSFIEITREISIEEAKKRWPNTPIPGKEKK